MSAAVIDTSSGAVQSEPRRRMFSQIENLFPGYFALVMATGIVSIAAQQQNQPAVARVLFVVAAVGYVVLTVLNLARLALYRSRFVQDLTSHAKGFAFLTAVAATNVLGSACLVVHGWAAVAFVLWWVGVCLWWPLMYSTLIAVVLKPGKPGLEAGINGTWFLMVVATESVAALGALLLSSHRSDVLAFVCLCSFFLGVALYLIIMTMVFLRWTFQELRPDEADPPAWIAAGAVAITVLAGSNLINAGEVSPRLAGAAPVLSGFVTLAWATATFWFPLMVAIGVWRHVIHRVAMTYTPAFWAMVFPLGMYSVATFKMLKALDLAPLSWLPRAGFVIAFVAWAFTFVGLCRGVVAAVRRPRLVAEG